MTKKKKIFISIILGVVGLVVILGLVLGITLSKRKDSFVELTEEQIQAVYDKKIYVQNEEMNVRNYVYGKYKSLEEVDAYVGFAHMTVSEEDTHIYTAESYTLSFVEEPKAMRAFYMALDENYFEIKTDLNSWSDKREWYGGENYLEAKIEGNVVTYSTNSAHSCLMIEAYYPDLVILYYIVVQ